MSQSVTSNEKKQNNAQSVSAAVATSALRGIALYFSRPVRLFKPVKASGWTSLKYAAQRDGTTLSPRFVSLYIKQHGISVLARHFAPPLLINTFLGTLLFTSYTTISEHLSSAYPHVSSPLLAAISGGSAGAIQALAGAPADNVRSLMAQGFFNPEKSVSGWRAAWKEVFRDSSNATSSLQSQIGKTPASSPTRGELRQVRDWVNEVRGMAGRGWEGWGWGCAKDVCGFALFFSIFEMSRYRAIQASAFTDQLYRSHQSHISSAAASNIQPDLDIPTTISTWMSEVEEAVEAMSSYSDSSLEAYSKASTPARMAQGIVLVSGGVLAGIAYEIAGRPFDVLRREAHIYDAELQSRATAPSSRSPLITHTRPGTLPYVFLHTLKTQGPLAFFRNTNHHPHAVADVSTQEPSTSSVSRSSQILRRVYPVLRTLARVGPWGIGFLVWEVAGPGMQ